MATGLSGLASGVDTGTIVDQLMALERQQLTKYTYRQRAVTAEQTALRDIKGKLSALTSATSALRGGALWSDVQSVSSSDPAKVAVVTPEGMVPPASITMKVTALATGAQTRYGTWAPPAADTRLWIADGVGISLKAGATVQDAANAINATGKAAYAGVVDGKLVLTSRETGVAATAPELREGASFDTGTAIAPASTRGGTNADFTVNGTRDTTRATNDFWLGDEGVRVTLKGLTGATDVTISATPPQIDKAAIKDKLKGFVDAYNAVVGAVNAKTTEKRVQSPSIGLDYEKGVLFGDPGLNGILSSMRRTITDPLTGLDDPATPAVKEPTALFMLGISTGKGANGASSPDAKMGKLVIDDAKLDAALGDPLAVKAFFGGRDGVEGFSAVMEQLTNELTKTTGPLESRIKGADDRVGLLKDTVSRAEERITAKEKRLKAQFAAMEQAMGLSQSQGAWLSGQIAGLNAQLGR